MKLLSPQQIHEWDNYTIEHEPVASVQLMERAARRCTDFILEQDLANKTIRIFCGKGNNGGDGLAIARQLIDAGLQPLVYILEFGAKGTDDFQVNLQRLHALTADIFFIQADSFFPEINTDDIVIDALFGSGLNRPLQDLSAALVYHINDAKAMVIAIDVPSGMFIDKSSKGNAVVCAAHTLTFQSPKLCFLVAENAAFFGALHVLDIGLANEFIQHITTDTLITAALVAANHKPRSAFAHKGTYGHALLMAGSKGKMGAAIMAAHACLRNGAGLVSLYTDEDYFTAVHTALPEAMCISRNEDLDVSVYKTIGAGPGCGTDEYTAAKLATILKQYHKPMLLDADALTVLSKHPDLLSLIPESSVLTPHPKEFERLFGKTDNDFERIEKAKTLSKQYPFIIVLKGHHTLIAYKGEGWFNTTGNAGMAKGGSGDVLSGMITALLAQAYNPLVAAVSGVYLHGLAADIAAQHVAEESMLATDIIAHISDAILSLDETSAEENLY